MSDILILSLIAFIIFYFLFVILGRKDDDSEINRYSSVFRDFINSKSQNRDSAQTKDTVISPGNKVDDVNLVDVKDAETISVTEASLSYKIRDIIKRIRSIENNFDIDHFILGAKSAFSIVTEYPVHGDSESLKYLTNDNVYNDISSRVKNHTENGLKEFRKVIKLGKVEVNDIILDNTLDKALNRGYNCDIILTVISEQVYFLKDSNDVVVEGAEGVIKKITTECKFSKKIGINEIVWKISRIC